MLYSSVYNLFAFIGRKAPFTHSRSSVFNLFALIGRKGNFTHSTYEEK